VELPLPRRAAGAETGSAFGDRLTSLSLTEREDAIYREIASGNVPDFLRCLAPVTIEGDVDGARHRMTFFTTPDYLSVGSDRDDFHLPMTPLLAQRLAELTSTTLPTRKMVDAIWNAAAIKLQPLPIPPGPQMVTIPIFWQHEKLIRSQLGSTTETTHRKLTAGHKKDVVITPRLYLPDYQNRVAIYGWHYPTGKPIQPLYLGHESTYADYSHGVRLVARRALLDGRAVDVLECLQDPAIAPLLNDEATCFSKAKPPRYPDMER